MSSSFSYTQQVTLAIMPKISSFASLCGSSAILMECLYYDRRKLQRVYHRLLCVMSVYDIIESSFNFMSSWPIPRGSPNVAFAVGTQQTCTLQGFVLQFGLAIPMLNLCLGFYYLLVIRYSWTESQIRTRAEPFFHVFALVIPLATCFISLYLDLFNNSNLWCWIAPLPMDCKDSYRYGAAEATCVRGDNAWIYRWAFYYAPLWFCILGVTGLMCAVYHTVHNLELQSKKFNARNKTYRSLHHRHSASARLTSVVLSTATIPDHAGRGGGASVTSLTSAQAEAAARRRNTSTSHREREGLVQPPPSKSRRVAIQALWYVGVFYLTFTFATVTRVAQQLTGKASFPLFLVHTILEPAQGLGNYIIYIRPRYLSFRDRNPDIKGFCETLFLLMTRQDDRGGGGSGNNRSGNNGTHKRGSRRSEMGSMDNLNRTSIVEAGHENFKKWLRKTRDSMIEIHPISTMNVHVNHGGNNMNDNDNDTNNDNDSYIDDSEPRLRDADDGNNNNMSIGQIGVRMDIRAVDIDNNGDDDRGDNDQHDRAGLASQYFVDELHADEEACKKEIASMRHLIHRHKQEESQRVLQLQSLQAQPSAVQSASEEGTAAASASRTTPP
jgi:hypothetical protein